VPTRLLLCLGLALLVGCSSGSTTQPLEDSGTDAGRGLDAGLDDGGVDAGPADAGPTDAGPDAGLDAGCTGGVADRLTFATAAQTLDARACSGALKVQLSDACGAAIIAPTAVTLTLSADSATTAFFGDGACIGAPNSFQILPGTSSLDVFFTDSAPTMSTITAAAAGLTAALQTETIACSATEKVCNATTCIPMASCCTNADCTAPKTICGTSGACKIPPCSGFPGGCSTYVAYSSTTPAGTITFGSSGYSPSCMHLGPTQTATFSGDFFLHPLEQTCGPADLNISGVGSTRAVKAGSFGNYGFHCKTHTVFEQGALQVP
jgi:hypothetical protein